MSAKPFRITTINGLKTVLYPIKGFPAIKANLLFHAGSSFEVGESWGAFHLMEHLCFEKTKAFNGWLDLELFKEEHGLKNNAYTGNGTVGFWTYGPSTSLNSALTLLNEIAFNTLLPEEGIKKQLSIITQEYAGKWDNPRTRFGFAISKQIYGQNHPYTRDGMGQPKFIETLTQKDLTGLHQKFFKNENALLTLIGDFDTKIATSIVQDVFTSSGGNSFSPIKVEPQPSNKILMHHEDVQQDKISIIWPGPGFKEMSHPTRMAMRIGSYILGGSIRSLLNQRLREELHLVYSTGFSRSSAPHAGMFECWAATESKNRDLIIAEARKVVYEFLNKPINEKVFLRSKNFLKHNINLAFDSIHSVSDAITNDMFDDGVIRLPEEVISEIQSIDEARVRQELATYLIPENEFLAIMTKM